MKNLFQPNNQLNPEIVQEATASIAKVASFLQEGLPLSFESKNQEIGKPKASKNTKYTQPLDDSKTGLKFFALEFEREEFQTEEDFIFYIIEEFRQSEKDLMEMISENHDLYQLHTCRRTKPKKGNINLIYKKDCSDKGIVNLISEEDSSDILLEKEIRKILNKIERETNSKLHERIQDLMDKYVTNK